MNTNQPVVYDTHPLPPGRILRREIDFRGISRDSLADRMGCPVQLVNGIIDEQDPVTPEIASAIERALGIKAYLWTNLEASYRATLAHNDLVDREAAECPNRIDEDEDDDGDENDYIYDDESSPASVLRDDGDTHAV